MSTEKHLTPPISKTSDAAPRPAVTDKTGEHSGKPEARSEKTFETQNGLHWTPLKPVAAGWYWWRIDANSVSLIALVRYWANMPADVSYYYEDGGKHWSYLEESKGQWLGPLKAPSVGRGNTAGALPVIPNSSSPSTATDAASVPEEEQSLGEPGAD